ncbi:MAG: TRAP transporter small permease subunit [Gammaproteobacteria bacterium]|nr:TRAP transporter small permease subunit [Gammaproteobacteria bacterium]
MDAFLAFSRRVKELIDSVLGTIAAVMLLILTLFALLEIVRRYIFDVVFEWGQDAIIVGMIATVSIYFAVTQLRRSHLVMNAIIQLLHARGHYKIVGFLKIIASVIVMVFCGAIGITGWSTLSYAFERDLMTYSLLIPLWPFYLILMFGFLLMALIALLQLLEDIIAFARKEYLGGEIELTTDV